MEAGARANALRYGLGANVYTHRLDNVPRCMEELEAGTVWFNVHLDGHMDRKPWWYPYG